MDGIEQRLRHQCMDWLAQREYSRHELAQKLTRRFFGPNSRRATPTAAASAVSLLADDASDVRVTPDANQLIEATLVWLEERQFLSDERCARLYVRSHIERGHGSLRIRQELVFQKRLAAELVDAQLNACGCDWFALAASVLAKRFRRPAADLKEKARQLRFLQLRGFTADQCYYALEHLQLADD